jgi:HEAT repeat protein
MSAAEGESVASMFERALDLAAGIDDDAAFDLVRKIVERRDRAYEIAIWRLRVGNEFERVLSIYILGLLSADPSEGEPDVVARILESTKKEKSFEVQKAVVVALRYSSDPRALPLLMNFATNGDAEFRANVIQTLAGCIERNGGNEGIDVLIKATRDHIDAVRNWAIFGLAMVVRLDSAKIREALFEHLDDENANTRRAAITGLSRRRDQRMVPILLDMLKDGEVSRFEVESAGYLRSKKLLPALKELKEWWDLDPDLLDASLERCDLKIEARNFAVYEIFRKMLQRELTPMFPGIEITLACDLRVEGGPVVVVASNHDIDISYPTVPLLLAQQQDDPEAAAFLFSEVVLRDTRLGRRRT